MLSNLVTLPTPPDEQFSLVRVLGPDGQLVATINAKTRVRTSVATGATEAPMPLPVWLSDPQKFHYQHPLVTGEKKKAPIAVGRMTRRKVRDWV